MVDHSGGVGRAAEGMVVEREVAASVEGMQVEASAGLLSWVG